MRGTNGDDQDKTASFQKNTIPAAPLYISTNRNLYSVYNSSHPEPPILVPRPTIGPKHYNCTIQPILPKQHPNNAVHHHHHHASQQQQQQHSPWPKADVPRPSLRFLAPHSSSSLVCNGVLVARPSAVVLPSLRLLESAATAAASAGGFGLGFGFGCILLIAVAGPGTNAAAAGAAAGAVAAAGSGSSSAATTTTTTRGDIIVMRTTAPLLPGADLPMAEFPPAEECRKREEPRSPCRPGAHRPLGGGGALAAGGARPSSSSEEGDAAERAAAVAADDGGGRGLLIIGYNILARCRIAGGVGIWNRCRKYGEVKQREPSRAIASSSHRRSRRRASLVRRWHFGTSKEAMELVPLWKVPDCSRERHKGRRETSQHHRNAQQGG